MARELFVYWKLNEADAQAAVAATAQMQAGLRQQHRHLLASLYRRAEVKDGIVTLMESYAHPGGVSLDLQTAIEAAAAAGLLRWSRGPRHVEVFEAIGG